MRIKRNKTRSLIVLCIEHFTSFMIKNLIVALNATTYPRGGGWCVKVVIIILIACRGIWLSWIPGSSVKRGAWRIVGWCHGTIMRCATSCSWKIKLNRGLPHDILHDVPTEKADIVLVLPSPWVGVWDPYMGVREPCIGVWEPYIGVWDPYMGVLLWTELPRLVGPLCNECH